MRKILGIFCVSIATVCTCVADVCDVYKFKMVLNIPRVYNNMQSLGYRKYQKQTITGYLTITYSTNSTPEITISDLYNKTHRMSNGNHVTYDCAVDEDIFTRVNVIGDNRLKLFKVASVDFQLSALPNYSLGTENEDNSLYIRLSGTGTTSFSNKTGTRYIRRMTGSVTGTLGCGCMDYGHISPTRVMGMFGPTTLVDDVAAVYGSWTAIRVKKYSTER